MRRRFRHEELFPAWTLTKLMDRARHGSPAASGITEWLTLRNPLLSSHRGSYYIAFVM
jgi:hypothetical protein